MNAYLIIVLVFGLIGLAGSCAADELSVLPEHWRTELSPIPEADLSGAERLMREAVVTARRGVAEFLGDSGVDRALLAGAYGRLGALSMLLEMETQADACFRNAGRLQPEEFRWPYFAGYLAMMAGNTDSALASLQAAAAMDPDYPTLHLRLGKVRLDRGELEVARTTLGRVAEVPGLASAAQLYLGQIANLQRRHQDAVDHLNRALAADPHATEVHYPLAQAYRALGRDALAREHLKRFERRAPVAKDPLLEQLQGATKRSLPAFQKALNATRQGKWAAAAALFEEGLAVDPDNAAARVSYARALYLAGDLQNTRSELEKVLEARPEEPLAIFLLGILLQQQGQAQLAAHQYRRTLEIDPEHPGALFYLANLDFDAGRYAQAAKAYAKVQIGEREMTPAPLLELVARLRAGEPEAAILERLQGLSAQHPQDPMLSYALARLLAAAADPALRDPERGHRIASRLSLFQPVAPFQRLLILTEAALGHLDQAAEAQRQLMSVAAWMTSSREQAWMQAEREAYERGELPRPAWPPEDPLLSPPPFDPTAPFRDYPASVPY